MYKSKYPSLIDFLTNQEDLILQDSEIQNIENLIDKDLNMMHRFFKKIKSFYLSIICNNIGFEWMLLLIPISLFAFIGWMWFDVFISVEFKEWYSAPIANMQIKDILIIGLIVVWFGRSSCDCKSDK